MNYQHFSSCLQNKLDNYINKTINNLNSLLENKISFNNITIKLYRDYNNYIKNDVSLKEIENINTMSFHHFFKDNTLCILSNESLDDDIIIKRTTYIILQNSLKTILNKAWLIYGISEYMSMIRSLDNTDKFKDWYIHEIRKRNKYIPTTNELETLENFKWNSFSYLLVKYLYENDKNKLIKLINNPKEPFGDILNKSINYYDKLFDINSIKTSLYDVKTPKEFYYFMIKNFIYGYIDKDGTKHYNLKGINTDYITNSVDTIKNNLLGTCIESVNFEKYFFDKLGFENKMFCYRIYDENNPDKFKMHCAFFYKENNFWYRFEATNMRMAGIYKFNTLDEAIKKFVNSYDHKRDLSELPYIPENKSFKEFNSFVDSLKKK